MIGKLIFKTLKTAVFWTLHIALVITSVALAMVFAISYWIIWLFVRWFRKSKPPVKLRVADFSFKGPIEELVGPVAGNSIDAVFEGGGVKALAQIGAVQAVEKLELKFGLLGGTSGGAIIASALAAGKKSDAIWELLSEKGLHSIVEVWYLPKLEFLQKRLYFYAPLLANLVFRKGMVSGRKFHEMMSELLKDKPLFKDVLNAEWEKDHKEPEYTLKMVATDISRGIPIVLPDDLPDYWEPWDEARKHINSDKPTKKDVRDWWPIADAVRMSMSIPFFFTPVKLHLNVGSDGVTVKKDGMGRKGQPVHIVDGGVSSNFPIWLYDRLDKTPPCPTFGFLLDEKKDHPAQHARITGLLIDLAASVISTGMGAMDKRLSTHDDYRTARLGTRIRDKRIGTTSFGFSTADQLELVARGVKDTAAFFDRFKWAEYISEFRRQEDK